MKEFGTNLNLESEKIKPFRFFTYKNKLTQVSSTDQQQNGNPHTNDTRNVFNKKVSRLTFLGKSKKVQWSDKRRYRNI
jgi:hypothetical protein